MSSWLVDSSKEYVGPRCLEVPEDGWEGDTLGEGGGEQVAR